MGNLLMLSESDLPFHVHFSDRWVMALKATAWRRVLIAQFEEYSVKFDDALACDISECDIACDIA